MVVYRWVVGEIARQRDGVAGTFGRVHPGWSGTGLLAGLHESMIAKIRQPREYVNMQYRFAAKGSIARQVPRAPGEFCIAGYRDRGVDIEMPGVIEDCGFGGLPASDVSQQDGATSRSWRPGSREPDIDFQNLPVTGLAQLFEPLSHEDLLFTSHRAVALSTMMYNVAR